MKMLDKRRLDKATARYLYALNTYLQYLYKPYIFFNLFSISLHQVVTLPWLYTIYNCQILYHKEIIA